MVSEGGIYMYKLTTRAYSVWNLLNARLYEEYRSIRPP